MPLEQPEPQDICCSCWYYDAIENSRFGVVMYCNHDDIAYVDCVGCDNYENVLTRLKKAQRDQAAYGALPF